MPNLTTLALALPDVQQGIACAGTALESRTFAVRKKTFLFVSAKEVRLKLEASAAEAKAHGAVIGANGWVKLDAAALPSTAMLTRWIAESYGLMAGTPKAVKKAARRPAPPSASKRARPRRRD